MSGNSRSRKRKPDHTFKYVQQNEKEGDKAKDGESEAATKLADNVKVENADVSDSESSTNDPLSKKTKKADEKKAQKDDEKKAPNDDEKKSRN